MREEMDGKVAYFPPESALSLGALAKLDDFLMNPLLQGHSGTTPETSRNMFSINQGTNEDD